MTTLGLRDPGFLGAGQGGLQSPVAGISAALWLDAADSSTITTVSGAVSQWNDKSGNGRHATQTTASKRPLYETNQFNGLPAIRADGVDDMLYIANTPMHNQASFYIHTVVKRLNSNWGIFVGNRDLVGAIYGFELAHSPTAPGNGINASAVAIINGSGSTQNSIRSTPVGSFQNNSFAQICMQWQTGSAPALWINGTPQTLSGWTAGAISNNQAWQSPDPGLGIFNGSTAYTSTLPAALQAGELLISNSIVATANRQYAEGVFAWKWGLTASLPSDHPYKNSAPT